MKNILVVYYTRTENSKKIADEIAVKLGCETDQIIDKRNYAGMIGYIKAFVYSLMNSKTEIEYEKDPSDYDVIVIVAPVWLKNIPPAIRTYAEKNMTKMRNYAIVLNNDHALFSKAFESVRKLLPNDVAECSLHSADIHCEGCQTTLEYFADTVRLMAEREEKNAAK